ncbi:MAG: Sec-independent protein translocase subunit TatA/TatB [Actinomycetota bacterium]
MPGLGGPELLLVVGAIVLLFGAKKLPEFARSLGKAKNEFKRGIEEEEPPEAPAAPVPIRTPAD